MSTITKTTYTFAPPQTTPPTSSDASPPSAVSPRSKSVDHPFPAIAHNTQDIVEIHPAPAHDAVLRFAVKGAALVVGSLIELWLLVDAMDGFLTFCLVGTMLWFVYGGHQLFVTDNHAPPAPIPIPAPDDLAVNIESWRMKVLPGSPAASSQSSRASFELKAAHFLEVEDDEIKAVLAEKLNSFLETLEAEQVFLELCGLVAVSECQTIQEAFVELSNLSTLFDHVDDKLKIYTHPNELYPTFIKDVAHDVALPDIDHCQVSTLDQDTITTPKVYMSTGTELIELGNATCKGTLAEMQQYVKLLQDQHKQPIFQLEPDMAKQLKHRHIHAGIVHDWTNLDTRSEYQTMYTNLRSIDGDRDDIMFMEDRLGTWIPGRYYADILQLPIGAQYQLQNPDDGCNPFLEVLSLYWHIAHGMVARDQLLPINTLNDVEEAQWLRTRNARSEVYAENRDLMSPEINTHRAYLTDYEEQHLVNVGIVDYTPYNENYGLSPLQEELRSHNQVLRCQDKTTIPLWLWSFGEDEAWDPNAYDPCHCGMLAGDSLTEYRQEKEPGYFAITLNHLQFPVQYIETKAGIFEREKLQKVGKEGTGDKQQLPRCQQISQICDLHALVTDDIFVLIDSRIDDPNTRISAPWGLLPVPGLKDRSVYPQDFLIKPGFREIPYEDLPRRCHHGEEFPETDRGCEICFPSVRWVLRNNAMIAEEVPQQSEQPYPEKVAIKPHHPAPIEAWLQRWS
ncbi:hypothetical protein BDU57DRAFT_109779 [Ampelomyces quisqualis]|uniref:Uncharacterized protein n=1 Tax=Ampelomyces quisqualis TaxID=50730 RepID=A0A6A5Q633_AMPQU|nr:hypothetical protein BDU57DRAFT_109779 [Ampelomyces quisqualis]